MHKHMGLNPIIPLNIPDTTLMMPYVCVYKCQHYKNYYKQLQIVSSITYQKAMKSYTQFHFKPCLIASLATILLFMSIVQPSALAVPSSSSLAVSKTFIKTSCNKTTYPKVCYNSLSPYAPIVGTSLKKLAKVSLSMTLKTAQNTSSAISKILKQKGLKKTELAIVRDCVENVKDSVYEVTLSLKSFDKLKWDSKSFDKYTMESIKTWMSAAITDEDTCMDGFEGRTVKASVKSSIRKYILKLAMVTSNALAIIDLVAY